MSGRGFLRLAVAGIAVGVAVGGCGSRSAYWNVDVSGATSVGLSSGVALIDDADHQVVILTATASTAPAPPDLVSATTGRRSTVVPVGHAIAATQTSADGSTLFVLSMGDPQTTPSGEQSSTPSAAQPSLTMVQIDPSTFKVTSTQYPMQQACKSLVVDPASPPLYAVAYDPVGFVQNTNELVVFDLTGKNLPVQLTLRSLGGTPQQLTFTPPLLVAPQTQTPDRRLLVVETQIDVAMLDLDHVFDLPLPRQEITVPLTNGTSGQQITPAAVAVDAFNPNSASDAQIALRASNYPDVFTFTFGPPDPGSPNDFKPIPNETPVGGVPSDMAFVHDDQGNVGLAVLVPSISSAVLVQPATSSTSSVALSSPYSNFSLVTNDLSTQSNGDVVLLWNGGGASGVALWTVGEQPYFSIDMPGISAPIQTVMDVPNRGSLRVLEPSDGSGFFVLNLGSNPPLVTPLQTTSQAALTISSDGERIWAFEQGGTALACIDLTDFSPINLTTSAPINGAYDVAGIGGGHALIALDMQGTIGATLFDALHPTAAPRRVFGLLLETP